MTEIKRPDHTAEIRPAGPRAETHRHLVVVDEVHRHSPAQIKELARLAAHREQPDQPRPAA